jgi:hypothetical protein
MGNFDINNLDETEQKELIRLHEKARGGVDPQPFRKGDKPASEAKIMELTKEDIVKLKIKK